MPSATLLSMQPDPQAAPTTSRPSFYARPISALLALSLLLPSAFPQAASILRLRVLEGEGQVFATGSRVSRPLTVQVTDETGKPIEGAAVSFTLPADGTGGVFTGNMRTDIAVTGPDGRAAMSSVQWNSAPGPLSIRVTARKDDARAGMISSQYLSDQPAAATAARRESTGGRRKWLRAAVLIGGAAAGGLAIGYTRAARPGTSTAATPSQPEQPVQIGTPSINIGKP